MSSEWRNPPGAGPTMRITCPNCGAQYEVDEALIPDAGRDVQCSNCGKGWFQPKDAEPAAAEAEVESEETAVGSEEHGAAEEPETPEVAQAAPTEEPESQDVAQAGAAEETDTHDVAQAAPAEEEMAEAEVESAAGNEDRAEAELEATEPEVVEPEIREAEAEAAAEPDEAVHFEETRKEDHAAPASETPPPSDTMSDDMEDEEAPGPSIPLPPRKTDENVLAVLREEAEREIAQRRNEAASLESQPDLGLTEPAERKTQPGAAEAAAGAAVAAGARRDLLPDIDEINSTLRSDADRAGTHREETDEGVVSERRRGFRLGFGLMILLVAVLIGLYVAAGWLAASVPALEPFLIAYVDWANGLGEWLDGLLASGVDGLSGLMEDATPGA